MAFGQRVRTLGRVIKYALLGVISVLLVFEGIYRFQLIDTYRPELEAYNAEDDLVSSDERETMLIMGDSFTAGNYSYASHLRTLFPNYQVVNAGMSGTGIVQANIVAPQRFETFKPSILIYQVYVGNDLINIRYPINWETVSTIRNVYGLVSDQIRSVSFLNYRLGQLWYGLTRPSVSNTPVVDVPNPSFSVDTYSPRQQIYIQADPHILEKQITVQGDRRRDYLHFLKQFQELASYCSPTDCQVFILLIPHAAQVHPRYLANMQALGAKFERPAQILADEYPFRIGIADNLSQENVSLIDPLEMLQDRERSGEVMYFHNDGHLTLEGQREVAVYIASHLTHDAATEETPQVRSGISSDR